MKSTVVLSVIVMCLLAGCGPKGPVSHLKKAAPAELPSGWTAYERKGVSLAIPVGWGLNPPGAMPVLSLNGEQKPENPLDVSEAELSQWDQGGYVMKMYQQGAGTIGESPTMLSVKTEKTDSLEGATADVKSKLGECEVTPVDLPIGKGSKLSRTMKSSGGDEVRNVWFVLVDGETAYRFKFECTNQGTGNSTPVDEICDDLMKTVRITPGAS